MPYREMGLLVCVVVGRGRQSWCADLFLQPNLFWVVDQFMREVAPSAHRAFLLPTSLTRHGFLALCYLENSSLRCA